MSKYKSKKTMVNSIVFDSAAEADYYRYLLGEKKAGRVLKIELQPQITLQPSFRLNGQLFRAITYTADFLVKYVSGIWCYIDVKGMETQQGRLKYKLYKYLYEHEQNGIELLWVAKSKKYSPTGWIDWFELQKIRRKNKREAVK